MEVASRNITVKYIISKLVLGMLERWGNGAAVEFEDTQLVVGQDVVEKKEEWRWLKRREERADRMGRGRRRAGKSISNDIGDAGCMLNSQRKFRKESQLSLLPSRFGWGEAVEGGN